MYPKFQLLLLNIDYFCFSGKRKTSYQRGENPRDGASTKGQKRPKERKQTKTEFCPYAQDSWFWAQGCCFYMMTQLRLYFIVNVFPIYRPKQNTMGSKSFWSLLYVLLTYYVQRTICDFRGNLIPLCITFPPSKQKRCHLKNN